MARIVRDVGRALWIVLPLLVVGLLLLHPLTDVHGATYTDPYYTNGSSAPWCACSDCGCERPSGWIVDAALGNGVTVSTYAPTGEVRIDFPICTWPDRRGGGGLVLSWLSALSNKGQFGNRIVFNHQRTLQFVDATTIVERGFHGLEVEWTKSGSVWSTGECGNHETLTEVSQGIFEIEDKYGNAWRFDANGLPDYFQDRNGCQDNYTYSGDEWTGFTDNRGKPWTIGQDLDDYIDEFSGSPVCGFDHDGSGNLTEIALPATPDQVSGSTIAISYDGSNRVSSITDARSNSVISFTWVGGTAQVDKYTIAGTDIDYAYATGRTDRTDRLGNVRRYHFSGQNITQIDMYVSGQAKYATEYRYVGNYLVTTVKPRGNRIDFTRDGADNVTERRQKTTDTNTDNDTNDIVESWTYSGNFVATATDPLGNVTTYTRDGAGNVTQIAFPTVTYPFTQSSVTKSFTYNGYGQLTQVTDEEGRVTTYTYFTSGADVGLLEKVRVDPTGLDLTTTYGYDANFNVDSITDPLNRTTTQTWDDRRRLIETQAPSPLSYRVQRHHDANGNLTSQDVENVDKDGSQVSGNAWLTTSYTYTTENQVATMTEEIDASTTRTTSFDHDANGNRIRVTKPEGNKEKWTYNERDLVASHIRGETDALASTRELLYDDNGNLIEEEDGRNYDTLHTYDLFDRRTRTTNALSHYTEWTFDKRGAVTQTERRDSSNNLLQREERFYDERGRHWKTEEYRDDPTASAFSDASSTIERFKTGHVKVATDARGKATEYAYDNAWRLTLTTDDMGNEFANAYDAAGNRIEWSIEEVDGGSTVTHEYEATYDALNRRLTTVEIDRTNSSNTYTTTSAYDSRSNLVWQVNAEGNPTRATFDGLGRMTKREVALTVGTPIENFTSAEVTEWQFDDNNRLTAHVDDGSNDSTWTYDALDRPVRMYYPDSSYVAYTHDAEDNVTEVVDPAGNDVEDTFDALGRNTARTVTRGSGYLDTTSESRTYDALNRMTANEDDDYKVEYSYAVIGLRSFVYLETQSYVGGTAYAKAVRRTHDEVGNKVTELYPSGLDLDYTWNDVDRMATVTDGTNTIASWTYIGVRPKVVRFQNGTTTTWAYGGFRQDVTQVHHETSTPTTLLKLEYGHNKVYDRTFERYGASGTAGDAFTYDKMRRLTTAWMGSSDVTAPESNPYVTKIEYTMDDDGNRSSVVLTPYQQSAQTTSYTTNSLYQYTVVGGTNRSHDGNGNLTDDGTLKFEYNYKNLICRIKDQSNNVVATYKYDANGRRVEKAVSGGVTERYVYSGLETVCVYSGSNALKQEFVFGQSIDEVLMLSQPDMLDIDNDSDTTEITRTFYHRNALGSVMEVTDMNQAKAVTYRYSPYGELTVTRGGTPQSADPLGQHWTYTGRFFDEESGLYYYRARCYDPLRGRFLQRDPLGYSPGPHLYSYASSTPVCRRDPHGLDDTPDVNPSDDYTDGSPVVSESRENELSEMQDALRDAGYTSTWSWLHFLLVSWAAMEAANSYEGPSWGGESGAGDAYRHCLWQCKVARAFGESFADAVGNIHERYGAQRAQAQESSGGGGSNGGAWPSTPTEQEAERNHMDSWNNVQGRDCAASKAKCEDCCKKKLADGALLWALNGDLATIGPRPCTGQKPKPPPWWAPPPIVTGPILW